VQLKPKVQPSDPELDKAINTFLKKGSGSIAIHTGKVNEEYNDDLNQRV
jgi:hypothetical protein